MSKRPTSNAFQNDVKRLTSAAQQREFQFVTDHFKTNPKMVSMAAELIRDGSLEKLLAGETLEQRDSARMLPVGLRRWRNLKTPLALRILRGLMGKTKHDGLMEALQEEPSWSGTLEVNLVKWGLAVDNDDALPTKVSGWRLEETFISMCRERHEQHGLRLDTWDPLKPSHFGYYTLEDDKPSFKCNHMGDKVDDVLFDLPLSKKVFDAGSLELQNNFSPNAILVTKSGVQVRLLDCVTEDIPITDLKLPEADWTLDPVRFPLAADAFSPCCTPVKDDAASSSGNSARSVPATIFVPPPGSGKASATPVPDAE